MDIRIFAIIGIFFAGTLTGMGVSHVDIFALEPTKSTETIRIGIVKWIDNNDQNLNVLAFKKQIDELNTENKNIEFIIKSANGSEELQREILQSYVDNNVNLIYTLTTPGTKIAKDMITDIPIVFSVVTYPVESGIIKSLEDSGNNLVGTRNYVSMDVQLNLIYETITPKNIGFVYRDYEPNSVIQLNALEEIAKKYDIKIIPIPGVSVSHISELLSNGIENIDVFYLACDTLVQSGADNIVIKTATDYKKPVFSCNKDAISKGALMGDVADMIVIGKMAGEKAALLLDGMEPSQLTTETQRDSLLIINAKVAEDLAIEIPDRIIREASIILR